MNRPQIHFSHLRMFLRCGEQYRRRYIEGERMPPGVALLVGSATHHAVEANMKAKLETGKLMPLADVHDAARDALNDRWSKEGVVLNEDEGACGEAAVKGQAVDQAVALAGMHAVQLAPGIRVQHVERPWVLELSGFPYDLAGRIDLIESLGADNASVGIRDTKTAAKAPAKHEADEDDQPTVYALALKTLDGKIPTIRKDYLIKTQVPKFVSQTTTRNEEDFKVLLRRVEAHASALDKGVFLPADQSQWWCSTKFCGYAPTCPFFRGRVQG